MSTKKNYRKHTAAFKTRVVLEALKERETLSELAQRYELHPAQISTWKTEFLAGAEQVFDDGPVVDAKAHEKEKAELHQQIGELTVTVNWLKKTAVMTPEQRRAMVEPGLKGMSIVRQCEVLEIHRSGLYYTPRPVCQEDLRIMRLMDQLHMEDPCRGTRRLVDELLEKGVQIGRDKVRRLMQAMRIKAVYCIPRTTVADATKYKFPYLLRELKITRKNQAWGVDITYVPIRGGFMYMVAVIDLYSRYILNWSISNSMEAEWVTAMITEAIALYGKPEIINSDQGCQFTSEAYTALFRKGGVAEGVKISMDGKGRAIDNVFIERFWRTLKHEHLYLLPPANGVELYTACKRFVHFYNERRKHSSIGKVTPGACYRVAA